MYEFPSQFSAGLGDSPSSNIEQDEINQDKFFGNIDFGNSQEKSPLQSFTLVDFNKQEIKLFYESPFWTFYKLMQIYLETSKCGFDKKRKICFRQNRDSNYKIQFGTSIKNYLIDNRSIDKTVINIGYDDQSKQPLKNQNASLSKFPLPRPKGYKFNQLYRELIITIKCNRGDLKQLKYDQYYYYTVKQLMEEIFAFNFEFYCLKFEKEIFLPSDSLNKIEKLKMSNKKLEGIVLKGFEKVIFLQNMKDIEFFAQQIEQIDQRTKEKLNDSINKNSQLNTDFEMRKGVIRDITKLCSPVHYYTCNKFFGKVNQSLRKINLCEGQNIQEIQYYNLCSSLFHSLSQFSNYIGEVYRGMKGFKFSSIYKQNDIVCWKSFTSSSKSINIASNFAKSKDRQNSTLFHIKSLTGKDISRFSIYPKQQEVLFSPYSYFIVKRIKKGEFQEVWLEQVPSPETYSNNILLWVDDKPKNNTQFIKKLSKNSLDILQITSTQMAQAWIKQFGWVSHWKGIKIRVVQDMVRQQGQKINYFAGVDLLQNFFHKHKVDTPILIFCNDIQKGRKNVVQQLEQRKLKKDWPYQVTNKLQKISKYLIFEESTKPNFEV